jgi:hypothetical protein
LKRGGFGSQASDGVDDIQSGADRALGIVLMRLRIPK